MDLFDSDDTNELSEGDNLNELFIELMKIKSQLKATLADPIRHEIYLKRSILIIYDTDDKSPLVNSIQTLISKLEAAHFIVESCSLSSKPRAKKYDIVIALRQSKSFEECFPENSSEGSIEYLSKDGIFVRPRFENIERENFHWVDISPISSSKFCIFRYRSIRINSNGCSYWTHHPSYNISREYDNLDKVTLRLSEAERERRIFSDSSHQFAVKALEEYGLCIFPGLFSKEAIVPWGDATRGDMNDALQALRERGIDLMKPGEGPKIENYYELSMREAFRVDLRNGKRVKSLSSTSNEIYNHSAIKKVLTDVMNPIDGEFSRGNWGMWNFEGPGPDIPRDKRPITIGHVGAVVSLPGCVDQTIHADTAHIFSHVHLPGCYYNLFYPASVSDDISLGQTAFVLKSHKLEVSAKTMADPGGQNLLESLLLRPHLSIGDALIFDCRILHFGLANQSKVAGDDSKGQRVMIYINHHQPWFHDPKNWNEREKLFP